MECSIARVLIHCKLIDSEVVQELSGNTQSCVIECRLTPREARIACRKIGCIITILVYESGLGSNIAIDIFYIIETRRRSIVAYIEETDSLAKHVTGIVILGVVCLCSNLQSIVSLGQQAEDTATATTLKNIIELTAAEHLGTCVVLAEHIVEVGLCQYTCMSRAKRYIHRHCTLGTRCKIGTIVGENIESTLDRPLDTRLDTHGNKLCCRRIC